MLDSIFWRSFAIALVAGLFYVGSGLNPNHGIELPSFCQVVHADESVIGKQDSEYVFSWSDDGRKIYMWKRIGEMPPKFMGESEAILAQ